MSIDPLKNKEKIISELDRILADPLFKGAKRSRSFLKYVCEKTVRGESNSIKEYSIAVDAFGLELNFDQQMDPRIRVEAKRLRDRLDQYYKGPGRSDETVISLEKGTYIPSFSVREESDSDSERLKQAILVDWRFLIALELSAPPSPGRETLMLYANTLVEELYTLSGSREEGLKEIEVEQNRAASMLLEIRGETLPETYSICARLSLGEGGALLRNTEIRLKSEKDGEEIEEQARREADEIVRYCRSVEQ